MLEVCDSWKHERGSCYICNYRIVGPRQQIKVWEKCPTKHLSLQTLDCREAQEETLRVMKLGECPLQGMKASSAYLACCLGSFAACQELWFGMFQRVLKLVQPWDYYLWCFSTWRPTVFQAFHIHSWVCLKCDSMTTCQNHWNPDLSPILLERGRNFRSEHTVWSLHSSSVIDNKDLASITIRAPFENRISRKRWNHLQKWWESIFANRLRGMHDLTRNFWKKWNAERYHIRGGAL